MAAPATDHINEVEFCGVVATAATGIFQSMGTECPFVEARPERSGSSTKRNDLFFYGRNLKPALTGEVKLPGGVSAFDSALVKAASDKAEEVGVPFFFTWDVNTFVLWDRRQWDKPLLEKRLRVWKLRLNLGGPSEVARHESLEYIKTAFLPDLIRDLSDIVGGRRREWTLPPDEVFLRSLESHLNWPISLLRAHLQGRAKPGSAFETRLIEWLVSQDRTVIRKDPAAWRDAMDNAARTLAYVWANRLIFYKALRFWFPKLPNLQLSRQFNSPATARRRLNDLFRQAAEMSGDYESLLFPDQSDWANDLVFEPDGAIDAWRAFLKNIESVDFSRVSSDIVGLIFQRLVSPEERHRFGQHFTGPDAVDLINTFCIRSADTTVLDPACGSGSFLVRAYYRKRALDPGRAHRELLADLHGCDIALYPAHLATLNLAARQITDEPNYPRIARSDFFDLDPGRRFCELPGVAPVTIGELDAIVGNPPYVRQEKIDKKKKPRLAMLMDAAFRGTRFSGRADLHCYFWPQAARLLPEGGWFGFLTSAQWLDVDYGFALQKWILEYFKIVAIMESARERWFPDARVKTCITILQRCADEHERMENPVRFVRFEKPLADLIGVPHTAEVGPESEEHEAIRQAAADRLRDRIEARWTGEHTPDWRILVKRQGDLWAEGVRAGAVLTGGAPGEEEEEEADETDGGSFLERAEGQYAAGKWGRYLRAPDLYFELMERFRDRFVPLGELVEIRRGITSGCDDFFMPHDVTDWALQAAESERAFRELVGVSRAKVESGELRVIKDGNGSMHPIEAGYIAPEVHSLMKVDRPVIRARDVDRVVLLVPGPLSRHKGTYAHKYIKYGETAEFRSSKSRAVPVPERSTCAAREHWFDLTGLVDPGFAFWPMAQQYRHVIPANPGRLICNHNLFDLSPKQMSKRETAATVGVLNSTLVGLFKSFYGRYAGTEGNLKTEVVDVRLIEVPDPRGAPADVAARIASGLKALCQRPVGHLVEDSLRACRSYERAQQIADGAIVLPVELTREDRRELDDAVFELLGVADPGERSSRIDRLYEEVAKHFRAIRVTEIQKMEDRRRDGGAKFTPADLADDAWDALDLPDLTPLADWVGARAGSKSCKVSIPGDRPAYLEEGGMFDAETVYFGKGKQFHTVCQSRGQAELIARMAELGVTGDVCVPIDNRDSMKLLDALNHRHESVAAQLKRLAEHRSGDPDVQEEVFELLEQWFVQGKPRRAS